MHCRHDSEASSLLLGVNFYGNDYTIPQGGSAIVGHEYLELLEAYKPNIKWEPHNKEHAFEYRNEQGLHRVYYPTGRSLAKRCELAEKHGMGIAIWEIGQGLEQFLEVL